MNKAKHYGIYCAGKISKNDWRTSIFDVEIEHSLLRQDWPTRTISSCDGLYYTGPYYAEGCDHGCTHGDNSHGWNSRNEGCTDYPEPPMHAPSNRTKVFQQCQEAINRSDIFFLWVNEFDCYGSLVELGWAKAADKFIVIAHRYDFDFTDMWFAFQCANKVIMADTPEQAFTKFCRDNTTRVFSLFDF